MSNNIDPKVQEIVNALTASSSTPWNWEVKNPEQNKYGGYDVGDLTRKTGEKTATALLTILPNKHGVDVISAYSIEDASLIANAPEYIAYLLSEYDRLTEGHDVALKALEKAEKFITTMMEFYGEGLTVHNWHQNGDGEPWDNFFDNNMEGDELESIRTALSHLKG